MRLNNSLRWFLTRKTDNNFFTPYFLSRCIQSITVFRKFVEILHNDAEELIYHKLAWKSQSPEYSFPTSEIDPRLRLHRDSLPQADGCLLCHLPFSNWSVRAGKYYCTNILSANQSMICWGVILPPLYLLRSSLLGPTCQDESWWSHNWFVISNFFISNARRL